MPIIDFRPVTIAIVTCALVAVCVAIAPAASASVEIAAAGDISCPADSTREHKISPGEPEPRPAGQKCKGHRVATMIKAEKPKAVLALGDLIQGQKSVFKAYADFSRAWVSVLHKKIFSTPGNHDYRRDSKSGKVTASGYFKYWKHKDAPPVKYGKPGLGWSSWNVGRWHMINLNSNCFAIDCSFASRQLRWLRRDLKADRRKRKTKCTLAYFHHPLFSTGVFRGRNPKGSLLVNVWELLYRYRTDIVLNGHQHHYERFAPQNPSGRPDSTGITQIISGTGGANTFPVEDEKGRLSRNSEASYRGLGATFLKLGNGKYRTYFRDLDGAIHDPTPVRKCNKPNAGAKRRAPRTRRYEKHMNRLQKLHRKIRKQRKLIKRLESTPVTPPHRLKSARKRLGKSLHGYRRVRESPLY